MIFGRGFGGAPWQPAQLGARRPSARLGSPQIVCCSPPEGGQGRCFDMEFAGGTCSLAWIDTSVTQHPPCGPDGMPAQCAAAAPPAPPPPPPPPVPSEPAPPPEGPPEEPTITTAPPPGQVPGLPELPGAPIQIAPVTVPGPSFADLPTYPIGPFARRPAAPPSAARPVPVVPAVPAVPAAPPPAAYPVLPMRPPPAPACPPLEPWVASVVAPWPAQPKALVCETTAKYGPADEASATSVVWHGRGPWDRIVVRRDGVPHNWPRPHMDYLEGTVGLAVPPELFDDLAAFDGSVWAERTAGTLTARCASEEMNFLALNLAHDLVAGEIDVDEARAMYEEAAAGFMRGERHPYTEGLAFVEPAGYTGDPDAPAF